MGRGLSSPAPTDMHLPSSEADKRPQTNYVCKCRLCGVQWQAQTDDPKQLVSCSFCGAGCAEYPAVTLIYEGPDYSGGAAPDYPHVLPTGVYRRR